MSIKVKVNGQWIEQTSNLDGAVLYNVTQTLTQEEQNKARENINTPSFDDIPDSISDLDNDSNYATEGYVDEVVEALPIVVGDDGCTDIVGMRLATNIDIVAVDNVITVTTTLEGNKTTSSIITLDENGYPSIISTDGIECKITWEGFDDAGV